MARKRLVGWLGSQLVLLALVVGCAGDGGGAGSPTRNADALVLKGGGATFPAILYQHWFETYEAENPQVAIDYAVIGSGAGEDLFLSQSVDFGASDAAALDEDEIASVERGVLFIPATAGSIVVAYNLPGFEGDLRLSRENYVDIFLGKIVRWDDPALAASNPGATLPGRDIAVVVRGDSSGTTFAFTNHLAAVSDEWRERIGVGKRVDWMGRAQRAIGNLGNAARVKRNPGTITYVQYGFAQQLNLRVATLENRAGQFVAPTPESGTQTLDALELPADLRAFAPDPAGQNSYPIVSLTWILAYEEYGSAARAEAIRNLLDWCLTEGQTHSRELGYVPLAPATVTAAREALARIHSR